MTQKVLEHRRRMKEVSSATEKKEVDRKASKQRKIRYIVHEKLVNFMVPQDNLALGESREAVLRSLFG